MHQLVDQNLSFSSYKYHEAIKILANKSYFKFAFSRNPWSRCLSAYLEKLVNEKNAPLYYSEIMTRTANDKRKKFDGEGNMNFEQFVRYLACIEDDKMNIHWKPQNLFLGSVKLDFIGKFENLKKDFEYIKDKFGLPCDLPRRNKTSYAKSMPHNPFDIHCSKLTTSQLQTIKNYPSYKEFYTEELVDLVRERYLEDVRTFGYKFI